MTYLTLNLIKEQVTQTGSVDDSLLTGLGDAVETATQNHLGQPLSDLADKDGHLPAALMRAMLMLVATLYDNRESVTFAQSHGLAAYEMLIGPYRKY